MEARYNFFKEIKVKHAECSHHLQQYARTNMHLHSCRFILSQNFRVYLKGMLTFENSGTIKVMCWLLYCDHMLTLVINELRNTV